MKMKKLYIALLASLGLALAAGLVALTGQAAPREPGLHPPRNSHIAVPTTTISFIYDEPISAATVTSHTFAVHGMQSGLVTATHDVRGNTIIVTPTQPFHQGELVYAIATTRTLNITGTELVSSTQWQFRVGPVHTRCVGSIIDVRANLPGVSASSVAWGDYDRDGDLDILLTGSDGSSKIARVYRNDEGAFSDISANLSGVSASSVAWGDYDNDGDLDILLTGDDGMRLVTTVYRNDAGTFSNIAADLHEVYAGSVAWGDYDNDGDLDILLTGYDTLNFVAEVYRNDEGVFSDIAANLSGGAGGSVAWGDYDNDGDLDILLTGYDGTSVATKVYNNTGGQFNQVSTGLHDVAGGSVAWGDYDNDGDLDILLTGHDSSYPVAKLYRNDDGKFNETSVSLHSVYASSVAWGDYDNDGDLDILLTGYDDTNNIAKLYRNDGGVFNDVPTELTGVAGGSVAWGDYDDDGDLDILLTGNDGTNPIAKVYRNGDCAADPFTAKDVTPPTAAPGETISYTISFSNAGQLPAFDVVITDSIPISVTNTHVSSSGAAITQTSPGYAWAVQDLAPGQGGVITVTGVLSTDLPTGLHAISNTATITTTTVPEGNPYNNDSSVRLRIYAYVFHVTTTVPTAQALGVPLTTTVSATFDGDLDPSSANGATLAVHGMLSGLMTGTLGYDGLCRTLTLTASRPFHAGEVIRTSGTDGLLRSDGELLHPYQWQFVAGEVYTRCAGDFTAIPSDMSGVRHSSAAWGDYDGDGDLDVLLTGYDGKDGIAEVYQNEGGAFSDISAGLIGVQEGSAAWGDYDNDGDLDILLTGLSDFVLIARVYRNDGGTFSDISADLIGVQKGSAVWGDYDNDGDLDILLTGQSYLTSIARVYRNDGGTFSDVSADLTGVSGSAVAWGDYDNDGHLDILLAGHDGSNAIAKVYRNDWGLFTDSSADLTGVEQGSVAWGDYDGDGDLDVLLTGLGGSGYTTKLYRNDEGAFSEVSAGLAVAWRSSVDWGDYDNDGDLDILLTGHGGATRLATVYRNDGGTFSDASASLTGVQEGSAMWGDHDGDGDLDVLLSGYDGASPITQIYRNDDCAADLVIAKAVTPPTAAPGESITYTLTFHNAGQIPASNVAITDSVPISVTTTYVISSGVAITQTAPSYVWAVQSLAPGEGGSITITGKLSDTLSAGHTIINVATIGCAEVESKEDNNSDAASVTAGRPAITVTKIASAGSAEVGETITYTYHITNAGDITLDPVVAHDDKLGAVALADTALAPDAATSGTLTHTIAEDNLPGPLINTATAIGTLPAGATVTATADATVALTSDPAIAVAKMASASAAQVGETITYTYRMTNAGNVTLDPVTAYDDRLGIVVLDATALAPNGVTGGTLIYTVLESDLPGPLVNTVTVTGTPPAGPAVTVMANAAVAVTGHLPTLQVTKSVIGAEGGTANLPLHSAVTYTIALHNSGSAAAAGLVMTDDLPDGVSFGGWLDRGGAEPLTPAGVITWTGDIPANGSHAIRFTATITTSPAFAGRAIVNTAFFTSANAGSGSDDAVFTTAAKRRIYLPLIIREG